MNGTHIHLIKNGVTDTEDVDDHRVLQQRQQVVGHPLPEMQQKVLDLNETNKEFFICLFV